MLTGTTLPHRDGTGGEALVSSIADISQRLSRDAVLLGVNPHLGFQRLVADAAARFSTIAPEAVDGEITECLRRLGDGSQLDCAVLWQKQAGGPIAVPTHSWVASCSDWTPDRATLFDVPVSDSDFVRQCGLRSGIVVPMTAPGGAAAALAFGSTTREVSWPPAFVEGVRLIAGIVGQALARKASHVALQQAHDEIRHLRDRLPTDTVELRREVKALRTPQAIVSDSATMRRVFAQIEQVAPTPATVLLLGETGAGKEVMAQAIHELSPRHQRPMIRLSCAAIPTTLIESELFGRERGAYTGALSRQIGRFEAANHSTLFLDEIGELPAEVQVKLLRVLQERVIERLGSTQSIKVDVRIIAATNRNLEDAVRDKTFREDLFYRLNVFPVVVPPLRERVEDLPALVWTFVDEFARAFGKTIDAIPKECLRELQRYPWPGNVRELRNVVERAMIVTTGRQLTLWPPGTDQRPMAKNAMTLSMLEGEHIRAVLEQTNWRVRGAGGAAERLGLKPTTLESRMARLGIMRKRAS
jgi:transcriptional regulator with GAF, ATPase, and Fis domain